MLLNLSAKSTHTLSTLPLSSALSLNLQSTGRDQYTLVARNAYRKLVTGLPDSSKGRDEDFLVFTGNWQDPHMNCRLKPGVPGFNCFMSNCFTSFMQCIFVHFYPS